MKWFQGSIGEAVAASKSQNAVFVVHIEGLDQPSTNMTDAFNDKFIAENLESSKFVCIKLLKDSEGHKQFSEIYKNVPVPSLYFIGCTGIPMEIVTGDSKADGTINKIALAIRKVTGQSIQPEASMAAASSSTVNSDTKQTETNTSAPPQESSSKEKVDIQEILKKKREENMMKEEEKTKEMELRRRQQGQELALAKRKQQDKELEELRKEREREKRDEAAARERVLRQIREDREARLAKQNADQATSVEKNVNVSPPADNLGSNQNSVSQSNVTRIQFRLPDCQTRTQAFNPSDTVQVLRNFIDANIDLPFSEYTLATTFPRREFTFRDLEKDLKSLELVPSGVVLILPVSGGHVMSHRPSWTSTFLALFWSLLDPIILIGRSIQNYIFGTGAGAAAAAPPRSSQQPDEMNPNDSRSTDQPVSERKMAKNLGGSRTIRQRGNVHSLQDSNDDSNDENNTWNGNSTQLM